MQIERERCFLCVVISGRHRNILFQSHFIVSMSKRLLFSVRTIISTLSRVIGKGLDINRSEKV